MPTPHRPPTASVALAALMAAALAGCASRTRNGPPSPEEETRFFAESPTWLNSALERKDIGATPYGAGAASGNPALRSTDPWLATVGVRFGVAIDCEMGVGLCVPGPAVAGQSIEPTQVDRVRQTAVGVWLKFDF